MESENLQKWTRVEAMNRTWDEICGDSRPRLRGDGSWSEPRCGRAFITSTADDAELLFKKVFVLPEKAYPA